MPKRIVHPHYPDVFVGNGKNLKVKRDGVYYCARHPDQLSQFEKYKDGWRFRCDECQDIILAHEMGSCREDCYCRDFYRGSS